jgi:hypothetical protein
MGAGFAQVGLLLLLTVVGLPLFFFGLMAALDRFERSLSLQPRVAAPRPALGSPVIDSPASDAPLSDAPLSDSPVAGAAAVPATPEAAVVTLPTPPIVAPSNSANASKPAAAV